MRECPSCGIRVKMGSIYCPKCGDKMKFVEKEVTANAARERKAEKIANLQEQLVQWIALAVVLFVVAHCFRDFSKRMPRVDVPPFFYGPATVGAGDDVTPMVIGNGGGYLDLGRHGLPVPAVKTLKPDDASEEERVADGEAIKEMGRARTVTITMKGTGNVVRAKLLGRTLTHLTVIVHNKVEVIAADDVESVQK